MTPPTWVRTLLLADPLEGVRSVGAVENDANLRPATAARDRSPPGRHRSSLPPPHGHCWPIPWRASAPSAPWKMMPIYGRQRLRGTASLQAATDHPCHHRTAIAGRSPAGRPLRRRREMMPIYGRQRLPRNPSPLGRPLSSPPPPTTHSTP